MNEDWIILFCNTTLISVSIVSKDTGEITVEPKQSTIHR